MNALLGDPRQYEVKPTYAPGPTGARALMMLPEAISGGPEAGTPGAALAGEPAAPSRQIAPAAALTAPLAPSAVRQSAPSERQPQLPPGVTSETRAFYEQAKRSGRNYRMSVEQRRKKRKALREFSKVMGSLEREVGLANDLRSVVETYKDLFYEGDAPNQQHMAILRGAAKHVTAAERLREQAKTMREQLQAQGISIPDDAYVDTDTVMEAEDREFDQFIGRGYASGLATMP